MVPVDGTTLVEHRVFVLGGDQEVLNGSATFEVGLNAILTTDLPSREGSNLLTSQAVHSQVGAHLPPREGSSLVAFQAGTHLPPREGSNLAVTQATQTGGEATSQAGAHLPLREGSSLAAS